MKRSIASVCVGSAFAFSAAAPMPRDAPMKTEFASYNSAMACQLSLPTIDTKVSPRATGFRNDGTAGTFVIFVSSSIALIGWGFLKPDAKGIGTQNLVLLVINAIGVYRYLIRKKAPA